MKEVKERLEILEKAYRNSLSGSALKEVLSEFITLEDLVEAIQALEEISLYKQGGLCLIPTEVYKKQCETLDNYKAIGTVEELELLQTFKELYEAYKVIGTIAEFRDLKINKNVVPIATIEINKEYIQKIVDEKVTQIEMDIQQIRNKAIDEFVEKIQWEYLNSCGLKQREIDFLVAVSSVVAEQLKGGAE